MMKVGGVLGTALLYAIHGTIVENILFEDSDGGNRFGAFNSTQAEETYLMAIAKRFWSQIFEVIFSNKCWLYFFMLFVTNNRFLDECSSSSQFGFESTCL